MMVSVKGNISIFRDHPDEGWFSMERYTDGLLAGFRAVGEDDRVKVHTPPGGWAIPRGLLLRRMIGYPLWARKHQASVNHVLDHSYGHMLYGLDTERTVVTIHDIAPILFPGHKFGLSCLAWNLAWRGALRAAKMIAVSEFTRQEVISRFAVDPGRIHTIPEGVEPHFRTLDASALMDAKNKFALPERFVLHVGSTQPRKNIEGLLRIAAGQDVPLVQAGGRPTKKQMRLVAELGLVKQVHFLGKVTEADLVALYNLAAVFVFPSLYEGFGFPPLEAMACGTPVVSSNLSSLPEVVGEAGLLVDSHNIEAFQEAVAKVLEDGDLAENLRKRGLEHASKFTWKTTARQTLQVYEDLYA
jgi:glycosyltransferase involved in cell wall biosynthesis